MSASRRVKVRSHPGATISDLHDHVKPHLRKNPTFVIMHVGTNDVSSKSADQIVNEMMGLRNMIYSESGAAVAISMPTIRNDSPKDAQTVRSVQAKLRSMKGLLLIDNGNIKHEHLSKRQLHLNFQGTKVIAKNFIDFIRN